MGCIWVFHGFSMGFPWNFPMVPRWLVFPMVPLGPEDRFASATLLHDLGANQLVLTFFFGMIQGMTSPKKKRRKTYENTTDIVINNGTFKLHLLGFEDEIWRKIPIDAVDYDHPHGTPHRDLASTW